MRLAVLGTGRMGGAMVGTLRRAGFEVAAWNRDPAKAEATGVAVGATPGEAVAGADVVITSLADDLAVEEVYALALDAFHAPQIALEMSTIAPTTTRRVAAHVAGRGAVLLDAPVSGSVSLVEKAELTIMVGGEAADVERARPVLEALSARLLRVGPLGAGATMKLAVNALVHGLNVALSESLVLAEKAGVDRSTAYEVFASGAAGAPFVQYKRPAFERPDETPVAFTLDLVAKDLDLILELAERVGAPMPQAASNREEIRAALAAGMSGNDMSALAAYLRGVERSGS
jgi:3-hydroxyisobutyrate dehydrogenase-like beta-hydroxyacid dehydrogenase